MEKINYKITVREIDLVAVTNYMKDQPIHQLKHIMKIIGNDIIIVVLEWKQK